LEKQIAQGVIARGAIAWVSTAFQAPLIAGHTLLNALHKHFGCSSGALGDTTQLFLKIDSARVASQALVFPARSASRAFAAARLTRAAHVYRDALGAGVLANVIRDVQLHLILAGRADVGLVVAGCAVVIAGRAEAIRPNIHSDIFRALSSALSLPKVPLLGSKIAGSADVDIALTATARGLTGHAQALVLIHESVVGAPIVASVSQQVSPRLAGCAVIRSAIALLAGVITIIAAEIGFEEATLSGALSEALALVEDGVV
jgi:hypothetical protein